LTIWTDVSAILHIFTQACQSYLESQQITK